jgi:hypothetical protein
VRLLAHCELIEKLRVLQLVSLAFVCREEVLRRKETKKRREDLERLVSGIITDFERRKTILK